MENKKNEIFIVSVEDTIKYGIIKAAIIGRVRWWCQYNKDNKVKDRFHNGEWWSGFMAPKVFAEQLGLPETTVKNNLVSLTNDEILIKDKFNKKGFDKTNWYRINPNPPQIQSSYRKDTTIVSERYNDSIGEIQSTVSERYNHSIVEGEPIPVSLSVNQNVKQTDKLPVNPPVNPPVEVIKLTNTDIKELIPVVKNIDAPEDTCYWVICLIKGEDIINSRKEQIRKYKHYFNKGTLLPKFLEQELEC